MKKNMKKNMKKIRASSCLLQSFQVQPEKQGPRDDGTVNDTQKLHAKKGCQNTTPAFRLRGVDTSITEVLNMPLTGALET